MGKKYRFKQASHQEVKLYCLVGESVCAVQHLEDAISHSIVIKKTKPEHKKEADILLAKHRKYTLGKAIKIAERDSLFYASLQRELSHFLSDRNWLIHKSIAQSRNHKGFNTSIERLNLRIKAITEKAHELQQLIEEDLIEFAEGMGADMAQVKAEINKYYFE